MRVVWPVHMRWRIHNWLDNGTMKIVYCRKESFKPMAKSWLHPKKFGIHLLDTPRPWRRMQTRATRRSTQGIELDISFAGNSRRWDDAYYGIFEMWRKVSDGWPREVATLICTCSNIHLRAFKRLTVEMMISIYLSYLDERIPTVDMHFTLLWSAYHFPAWPLLQFKMSTSR